MWALRLEVLLQQVLDVVVYILGNHTLLLITQR
jgi:hypothetical protein